MRMGRRGAIWALALCALPAATLSAAERFSVGFEAGYQVLSSATDSAKAVFDGSTGGATFGGSLRFSIRPKFFVGAGFSTFSKQGERVFVASPSSPVFELGHPLEIQLNSVYGFAGFRPWPNATLVPYISLGAGQTSYQEESTIGGLSDSSDESKFSWHAMAGVDYRLPGLGGLAIGAELRFASAQDLIGLGGVSKVYGETDLGGFSAVARISFQR